MMKLALSAPSDRSLLKAPLFWAGALMLALVPLLAAAAGLDERALLGRSPWDKPLRFALSLGVYAVTMAMAAHWLLARSRVPGWRWLSPLVLGALVFEMGWILVQAARGVDSHFNDRTTFEDLMFGLMGLGAGVLSLGALWLGLVASRLTLTAIEINDRVIALGIALGFVGTGLLLPWTGEALVDAGRSQSAFEASSSVPLLGWRLDGSDPRPAHFVAAHLMQALPLVAAALARVNQSRRRAAAVGVLLTVAATGVLLTLWLMPWMANPAPALGFRSAFASGGCPPDATSPASRRSGSEPHPSAAQAGGAGTRARAGAGPLQA
jgi:hypothetical protein